MDHDTLFSIGEALIDFIPDRTGCSFDEVASFAPAVGGAPTNVCAAFTRLGGKSALISQLGDDPFGHKIAAALQGCGIDLSHVPFTTAANTSLAFVSLGRDGNRTFSFYRNPSADLLLQPEQIERSWFSSAFALHFCSVSLVDYPIRRAHEAAISYAKDAGALISFDPNLRFSLWNDLDALKKTVWEFIPKAQLLKVSDEEVEFLTGCTDIEAALPQLMHGDVQLVVYTCGKDGAWAFTRQARAFSPSQKVQAVDTTGAGDAFIGSFLHSLWTRGVTPASLSSLSSEALQSCLAFSNRYCGKSVQKHGAIDSYPTMAVLVG